MTTPALVPEAKSISFNNILFATDFSDASERAFPCAVAIARRHGSKISLVHVLPPESVSFTSELPAVRLRREAERQLQSLASRSELNQIPHEALLRSGSVWSVLSDVIHQLDISLVVLGTHGRSGLKKILMGSAAEGVLRSAGCAVLTVGPNLDPSFSTTGEFRTILFATDFHSASAKALEYAQFLTNEPKTKLILLHVMPPAALPGSGQSFYDEQAIKEWQANVTATIQEKLRKLLPPGVGPWPELDLVVSFDFIAEGIVKAAASRKADLIIMGAKRSSFVSVSAHSLGALSYDVIRHAICPVLTAAA